MSPTLKCPDVQSWQKFSDGLLPTQESADLERHLINCQACVTNLDRLPSSDTLVEELRAHTPSFTLQQQKDLQRLVDELKKVLPTVELPKATGLFQSSDVMSGVAADTVETAPDKLGRYQVKSLLGSGGMGAVYLAHDPQFHRSVAIKIPRFNGDPQTQQLAHQRFLREARAAAAVRHPHICPVYDLGEEKGRPFVVMAFVEGTSLAHVLSEQPKLHDVRKAVKIAIQTTQALTALHAQGIIHRDLKPGNILIEKTNNVLLTDFGLAKYQESEEKAASTNPTTVEGAILGTPMYMAPEQVVPELGAVSPRSDLYSLGVVLYQMLTGAAPLSGNAVQIIGNLARGFQAAQIRTVKPDVDPQLARIVDRLLSREPQKRYGGAAEVLDALQTWMDTTRTPVPPLPTAVPTEVTYPVAIPIQEQPVSEAEPETAVLPATPRKRSSYRVAIAAALVLLVPGIYLGQVIVEIVTPKGKKETKTYPPGTKVFVNGKEVTPDDGRLPPLPAIAQGDPLTLMGLVGQPATIKGVQSWLLDTVRPRGEVIRVVYSPDGKQVAAVSTDSLVRIFDPASGKLIRAFVRSSRSPGASNSHARFNLLWSPNGKRLACSSLTGEVHVFEVDTGKVAELRKKSDSGVISLAWSPDGKDLAVGTPINTIIYRVATGEIAKVLKFRSEGMCFSREGDRLFTVLLKSKGQHLHVIALRGFGKDREYSLPAMKIAGKLALSPDSKTLAVGGYLWNESWPEVRKLPGSGYAFHWSADGKRLMVYDGHYVWDCDGTTGKGTSIADIDPRPWNLHDAEFAPDGKSMVHSLWSSADLIFWDVTKDKKQATLVGHAYMSSSVSADGRRLVSAHPDKFVRLWDLKSPKVQILGDVVAEGYTAPITWSSDSNKVALVVPYNKGGGAWDLSKAEPRFLELDNVRTWSPDGTQVATRLHDGTGSEVRNTATKEAIASFKEQIILSWSPDGKKVVWYDSKKAKAFVGKWPTDKLEGGIELGSSKVLIWSPDSKTIYVAYRSQLVARDADTGKELRKTDDFGQPSIFLAISLSHDGMKVAAMWGGGGNGTPMSLSIYDAATFKLLRKVSGSHYGFYSHPDWLSDNRTLLTGGNDGMLQVFDTETGKQTGALLPLPRAASLYINAEGHYRAVGPVDPSTQLIYIAQLEDGRQMTYTPEEFEKQHGWKNNPARVRAVGETAK